MSGTDQRAPAPSELHVDGPHGPVRVRVYPPAGTQRAPGGGPGAGLVWMHGGAFRMGDLEMPEAHWVSSQLAGAGVCVVSVDYRLAVDGVHFPVPGDDVLAVWQWATATEPCGVAADRWHLGGGSAGANLAASVTLRARGGAARAPRSNLLVYPVMHAELPAPSPELARQLDALPATERFLPELTDELNLNYVGDPDLLHHPHAFPGHADPADLAGMPPTLVVTSERDDLRPSGEAYAAALAAAGVEVTVLVEADSTHGHLQHPELPAAGRTLARLQEWLTART